MLTWPNLISIVRALLVAPYVACMLNLGTSHGTQLRHAALGMALLMALSDWLDGYLARRLHLVTDMGKFLDPLGDKLLIFASVLLLATTGVPLAGPPGTLRLPNWVVVATVSKDVAITLGFVGVYVTTGRALLGARRIGKWCTTVQFMMVLAFLLTPDLPTSARWLPPFMWWLATLLAIVATCDYIQMGYRRLSKPISVEPPRVER